MFDLEEALDLGVRRAPINYVVHEHSAQTQIPKIKRLKGTRGKAAAAAADDDGAQLSAGLTAKAILQKPVKPEQLECLRLKREAKDPSVTCLEQEDEEGNVEYKFRIKDPHPIRLQQLITQMKFRLSEGNGECFYYIGVEDNGYPKGLEPQDLEGSVSTLHNMAASLGATAMLLEYLPGAWGRRAALLRVSTSTRQEASHSDLRIVVAGCVDAGKSSLVAVLTHGAAGRPALDNGRGAARMNVLRHKHEMQSGRTSSISHQTLGYDAVGRVLNYGGMAAPTPAEISAVASKVVTFLDMGGHEKYLKTALYGLTALLPDYVLLAVCAVGGLGRISVEHLAVAVALEIPVAVVITKVDLVGPERLAEVVAEVRHLVEVMQQHEEAPAGAVKHDIEAAAPLVMSDAGAQASAQVLCRMHADSLLAPTIRCALRVHVPVLPISSVTGGGLPVLHAFLSALQPAAELKGPGAVVQAPDSAAGSGANSGAQPRSASACSGHSLSGLSSPEARTPTATSSTAEVPEQVSAAPVATAAAGASRHGGSSGLLHGIGGSSSALFLQDAPVHFQVDHTFEVEGVGSVVSGTVVQGAIRVGSGLMFGPTALGTFQPVRVTCLQRSQLPVRQVRAGQTCTIALSPVNTAGAECALGVSPGTAATTLQYQCAAMEQQRSGWPTAQGGLDAAALLASAADPLAAAGLAGASADRGAGGQASGASEQGEFDNLLQLAQQGLDSFDLDGLIGADANNDDDGFGGLFDLDTGSSPKPSSSVPAPHLRQQQQQVAAAGQAGSYSSFSITAHGVQAHPLPPMLPTPSAPDLAYGEAAAAAASAEATLIQQPAQGMTGACAPQQPASSAVAAATAPCSSRALGAQNRTLSAPSLSQDGAAGQGTLPLPGQQWEPGQASCSRSTAAVHAARAGLPPLAPVVAPCPAAGTSASIPSSAPAYASSGLTQPPPLQTSWTFSRTSDPTTGASVLSTSPPVAFLAMGCSAGNSRKGAVLLDPAMRPRTSWSFEAVLVLLGGHWPARGLLSGRWPIVGDEEHPSNSTDNCSTGRGAPPEAAPACTNGPEVEQQPRSVGSLRRPQPAAAAGTPPSSARSAARVRSGSSSGAFTHVVHCGSVRQLAQVVLMQELVDAGPAAPEPVTPAYGCCSNIAAELELQQSASMRAAAALLQSARGSMAVAHVTTNGKPPQSSSEDADESPQARSGSRSNLLNPDLGCLVRVVMRFSNRPEWLREGARLLVRDRGDGHVAGAGFVKAVLD